MLTTYLKTLSSSKLVVIQDSLVQQGKQFLVYLINSYDQLNSKENIHYCEFESIRYIKQHPAFNLVKQHNFIGIDRSIEDDLKRFEELNDGYVVINSVGYMVLQFGPNKVYKILSELKRKSGIKQIVCLLHDYLFSESNDIFRYLEYLAALYLVLEPPFNSIYPRIMYTYKKSGGKIIKDIELYKFETGNLVTMPIEKIDPKSLIEEVTVAPETLTTFKIGLDEKDRALRDKLVLPYLPKDGDAKQEDEGGQIIYQFDDADDWDEEDPDDDLDI